MIRIDQQLEEIEVEHTQLIIGIPGNWKSRTEIIQAIASKSDGFLMAGDMILNSQTSTGYQVEVYEYDHNLCNAFNNASRESLSKDLLAKINNHTHTLYVITDVRDIEDVINVIDVGAGLLKAGGIAVKIENSGVALSKEIWLELQNNHEFSLIYSHFVNLVGDNDLFYSCGMQFFGLPDVIITSNLASRDAANLINHFNLYNLVERPTIKNGETFSIGQNTPITKIQLSDDSRYDKDDLFYNKFGLIELREKKDKGNFWKIFK
ncbi:DUF4261 domain-containing protein [Metabacillus sp. cB07]|uniref:DUF4261 domain-containing protein n=1 Tax=Metabacillus sp. cB07 TaxID=2806989 RepID=UPI001F5DB361|nr:DUF4261 domain-containing protein [Metabacillus sp. cB07]